MKKLCSANRIGGIYNIVELHSMALWVCYVIVNISIDNDIVS